MNVGVFALMACCALTTAIAADATDVQDVGVGAAVEHQAGVDAARTQWTLGNEPREQGDRLEVKQVREPDVKIVKLQNVVPAIHFGSGEAQIPPDYTARLRDILARMKNRRNVRLHFVGHTDNVPLAIDLKAKYGDNMGLSRERAGTVAEYFQRALNLPPESISYEGMGDTRPVAPNTTDAGRAQNRRVEVEVWYDDVGEKLVDKEVVVPEPIQRVKVCRIETVCKLRYKEGHAKRARIKNLVPPLHFDDDTTSIPADFLAKLRQVLSDLKGKSNLVIKFIGYTDDQPLTGRAERIYGTHEGLSKARALRAALAVKDALKLPTSAIAVDGRGAAQPLASNETEKGRALNRRIEVEFWYDDPLQQLPDEPQICPEAAGAELETKVYDPPSGAIKPILYEHGKPVIPDGYAEHLKEIMDGLRDKTHVRLRFIGYTSDRRLDRRTAMVYGDDIGLSTARARRAMEAVKQQLGLGDAQAEFEGHGFVQSDDVVNTGFIESDTSHVDVQVVYDELAALDDDSLEVTRLTREVEPKDPFALNLMRITVDGKPIDDPGKSIADIERCTDVALDKTKIQFKFDDLELKPRLNVTAWPTTIRYDDDPATEYPDNLMQFRMYTNYAGLIDVAEIRVFDASQSERDEPLVVLNVDKNGRAEWAPRFDEFQPNRELKYVLRVYDKSGHFDETKAQPIWIVDSLKTDLATHDPEKELLTGYGETRIAVENIPKQGGTIRVSGSGIPPEHSVWVAGRAVPVDKDGNFVAETILPPGLHTVEVGVLDREGNGQLFLRDLALRRTDWFYVGIADVTVAKDKTTGPAKLVTGDQTHYNNDVNVDGRLAFYAKGRFRDGWKLTTSADTREGPVKDLFSNFLDKQPEALFRRIDPDLYYPTFGDDSTVEEDAPTLGKFYLKLEKNRDYGLWGNFKIGYNDNTLAQVDRGLYGANAHYQSLSTTSFGEQRFAVDGFTAQPGTVASRDEFRGTDGSLYFLRHQDILTGSERVRIEVRDKDSGIVLAVKNLAPTLDYDIDYLQGRVVLAQPLPATASDNLLVSSGSISGNPVFLVVRYEFTPGVGDIKSMAVGGQSHVWLNDYVKLGVTSSRSEETGTNSGVSGTDLTLRKSAESWIKVETSKSKGPGTTSLLSGDGGFSFGTTDPLADENTSAGAARVETSLGFKDVYEGANGKLTYYKQSLDAGFSAPGLATPTRTDQHGGTLQTPITQKLSLTAKTDEVMRDQGLQTSASEADLGYQLTEHWKLSSGVRRDERNDRSPVVPLTQVQGERTDVATRVTYDTLGRWSAYGFVQNTVDKTGNREDNGRVGSGGSWRVTDRLKVNGEVSSGDLGGAGTLGTEYLYSDRTNLYLNYVVENESADNGIQAKKGNLVSGFRTRYSDSASVYVEERYAHGDVPTGLTHTAGVDLAPSDRWNLGGRVDFGTLRDNLTGAKTERKALGVNVGYGFKTIKLATAFEYRTDETEAADTTFSERKSWLVKNSLKYQLTPDWRVIGKFNRAESQSTLGTFFDGNYTEAVLGYAYRPVNNDRLNALFKYTYFYNVPTPDQITSTGAAAELIQKSHVVSLDTMYDVTKRWSLGGKYAYRLGQVSQDRVNPQFFDSRAQLYILRADWQFVRYWDALVEGRVLDLPDAQDRRSGGLFAVYWHMGNNIKLGAGYNFTDFSDDLTDLSYTSRGWFVNVIGTL